MISSTNTNELQDILFYLEEVPYDVTRKNLYSPEELYQGYDPAISGSIENCYDSLVYRHYVSTGKQSQSVRESMARAIHDHGMHTALDAFFSHHDQLRCIGIMGGHSLLRTDEMYRIIAMLSKRLTELGFCMLSGGGPGAMEATHLGAWMAGREQKEVDHAFEILSKAPSFKDEGWMDTAFMVRNLYPQHEYESLGIPTWLYGHEPSTAFATHIAKFFENSIREDSILTLAFGGIIYAPGSAGTMQEIFQDAVQNHYLSYGFSSPMIFLGTHFWTEEMPVFPLLQNLMESGKYKNLLLSVTDDTDEIIDELIRFRDSHGE